MQRITKLFGQLLLLPSKTKHNNKKGTKLTQEEHIGRTKHLLYECNQMQVCTKNVNKYRLPKYLNNKALLAIPRKMR